MIRYPRKICVMLELLVVLLLVAGTTSLDCSKNDAGYTLPCNKNLDPWKETRTKLDSLTSEMESAGGADIWTRLTDGKEKVEFVLGSHEALTGARDAVSEALSDENADKAAEAVEAAAEAFMGNKNAEKAADAAKDAADTAGDVAEKAKGATKWLQKGAKALKVLASAAQFVGPILDIVLLFAPASKSDELVAIESGFAKMGAKIDSVAHKLGNVEGALDWNVVVGKLMEFEATVDQTTKKYNQLVEEIKATDFSRELPLSVKGQIEDLVDAIKNPGDIGNQLQLVDNLFRGKSGFTKGKTLLDMFVEAVDNDCSKILPMSNKLIKVVKDAQRLQYFYEINQQLTKPNDDKGYPKMVYEMYTNAMSVYQKCTKNAVSYAQKEMKILYADGGALTSIIDGMEPKFELYNWATMKEDDKEDDMFSLVDNSAGKLDVELTGISEDDQEEQRLTLLAVRKASKAQVKDAVSRVKKVIRSLQKNDLPTFEPLEDWNDEDQKFRDEKLTEMRNLFKKDAVLKSLIDNKRIAMAMFKNDSKISLTGWHFKTNMEVVKIQQRNYRGQSHRTERLGFTVGFLFNFEEDLSSFSCVNGQKRALSVDSGFTYCLCNMGYGGEGCDILLNDAPRATLSSAVLKVVENYKVPGMFDLQSEIKKGTETILHGIENNKLEIFAAIKNSGKDVEKSKNAILSAQSMMLDQMKAQNAKVLNGISGLQIAMEAAFERERNDRIYRTEQGQKVVMKAISDSNRVITDSIKRLTGKVIENRYFKELKIYIPVYQDKFQDAVSYGGFAELVFNKYLESNEHNFQAAKESALKAMVTNKDSFVMAQMQTNMVSGCTDEYTETIVSTWAEMMELHLAMTTMEFWNLDYKMKTSPNKEEADYWNHRKEMLDFQTKSDTDDIKQVVASRSCPAFSQPDLVGGGCGPSIIYPGQQVPMQCKDDKKTLILLSNSEVQPEIACNVDSTWAVDMGDLECIHKCKRGGKYYDIGEEERLPDAPRGYYFADDEGIKVTESICGVFKPTTAKKDTSHRVLNGTNFKGADLKELSGVTSMEDCLQHCEKEAKCVAVTYQPPNKKIRKKKKFLASAKCWLKNKQFGEVTESVEGVNSANLRITGPRWIEENVIFAGADIRMVPGVLSMQHCSALCGEEAGCLAVSFQPANSTCWLKSKEGGDQTTPMDGVNSANLKSSKWVHDDTDFKGADIRNEEGVQSIQDCLALCAEEPSCASVTFQKTTSTCWLKDKEFGDQTKPQEGVKSANLKNPDTSCTQVNVEYRGANIMMESGVLSTEDCLALCKDHYLEECVSVTHETSSARCWLKNKEFGNVSVPLDGVNSANLNCADTTIKRSGLENLALNQTAEQVDDYDADSTASKAVDGNRNGSFTDFSGSQTGSENGWWKVTLSFNRYISYVDIYNRLDCCQDRLKNARVLVDGDLVAIIPQVDGIQGYTIPVFRRGQVVSIEGVSGDTLQLAEVEVYGLYAAWSEPQKIDINECAVPGFCNTGGTCRNTYGSFLCSCSAGYKVGEDKKCHDVNECLVGSHGYQKCLVPSSLGTCVNSEGSYSCGCLSGSYTTPAHKGKECLACNCNSNGVTRKICNRKTGECLCNTNVGGADCGQCKEGFTNFPYCTQCAPGYYGYPNCQKCSCTDGGLTAQKCDPHTGACLCNPNVAGKTCDVCKTHYVDFPRCVPDVRDGTLSAWGPWTKWVEQGSCGPSYMKGYTRTRSRTRTCDDSTKNIHGRSCSGDLLVENVSEFANVCKPVNGVFITLHTSYYAGTTADLWMGLKQGSNRCTTSRPTWDAPDEEDWQKTYWKSAYGCSNTFDETKSVDVYLYSDSSNDVRVTKMGAKIGDKIKTWYTGGSYTSIDEDENNGWYTAN